jgi:hypothetical protein
MTPRYRLVAGLVAGLLANLLPMAFAIVALPTEALAQSTTWTAAEGDWGTASNWSAGEPTAGVDAVLTSTAQTYVTLGGEVCRQLRMGSAGGARLDLTGGSLTVDNALVGLASPNIGASLAMSAIGGASLTVTHSLTLGRFSDIVLNGGTTTIGTAATDSLVVLGTLQIAGTPTATFRNLALRDGSVFSCIIPFTGITGYTVSGTAVLNGKLLVQDFSFSSEDVTYEIIRANQIVGTFDEVQLPATGNWSWRIEGNSVFITRGMVPVEPATWSGVKAGGWARPGAVGR